MSPSIRTKVRLDGKQVFVISFYRASMPQLRHGTTRTFLSKEEAMAWYEDMCVVYPMKPRGGINSRHHKDATPIEAPCGAKIRPAKQRPECYWHCDQLNACLLPIAKRNWYGWVR
jgi:hypothetical protein